MTKQNSEEFLSYCMRLYDSNCYERKVHNLEPFETFEDYYNKYTGWLRNKYDELEASTRS
jgi:hypothetical protein